MLRYIAIIVCILILASCSPTNEKTGNYDGNKKPAYGDIMVEGSIGDASEPHSPSGLGQHVPTQSPA